MSGAVETQKAEVVIEVTRDRKGRVVQRLWRMAMPFAREVLTQDATFSIDRSGKVYEIRMGNGQSEIGSGRTLLEVLYRIAQGSVI